MLKEQAFYLYKQETLIYVKKHVKDERYTLMYDSEGDYRCATLFVYDRWLPDFQFMELVPRVAKARYYKYLAKHPELSI